MKYKNYQIKLLMDLLNYSFPAPQARGRNRFIKVLVARGEESDKEIKELIKEFTNKDEKGELIIKGNQYDIPLEKMDEFNKQFKEIMDEEFIIAADNSLKEEDIETVKGLIKNTNHELNPPETEIFEEVLKNI